MTEKFKLQVVGPQVWSPTDDNVDVEVRLPNGDLYVATFFTLANLQRLFEKNRESGECLSGRYFWASDMILVEELTIESMTDAVEDLIANGEFAGAFRKSDEDS